MSGVRRGLEAGGEEGHDLPAEHHARQGECCQLSHSWLSPMSINLTCRTFLNPEHLRYAASRELACEARLYAHM